MRRNVKEVIAALAEEVQPFGLSVEYVEQTKHIKARIMAGARQVAQLSISGTPSTCHCISENRRLVRRILRSHGYAS